VCQHGNGWRVQASIGGSTKFGPTRALEAEADEDLRLAQTASCEAQYVSVLQQLRAVAGNLEVSHRDLKVQTADPSEPSIQRQRTKGTPSSVVSQSAFLSLGASSSGLCRNEEDTISTSAAASSGLCLPGATHSLAQSLCLRGLNVQYPFSQLILEGLKVKEARTYKLGKRNIAHPGEEMFLIETPGSRRAAGALVEGRPYDKQAFPLERLSSVFRKGIRP
jgi:hypothetical protein